MFVILFAHMQNVVLKIVLHKGITHIKSNPETEISNVRKSKCMVLSFKTILRNIYFLL